MGSLFLRLSGLLADFDLLDGHVWIELCRFQNRLRQFLKSNFTFDQNCYCLPRRDQLDLPNELSRDARHESERNSLFLVLSHE